MTPASIREHPEVSFDKESNMNDGEVDMLGNTDNIQNAFNFFSSMDNLTTINSLQLRLKIMKWNTTPLCMCQAFSVMEKMNQ